MLDREPNLNDTFSPIGAYESSFFLGNQILVQACSNRPTVTRTLFLPFALTSDSGALRTIHRPQCGRASTVARRHRFNARQRLARWYGSASVQAR